MPKQGQIININIDEETFRVDASLLPAYWHDIKSGNWETHSFKIIDAFVKSGDTVLDVGCWAGPLSLYMAAKGAEVFSIEPDPVAYTALVKNIALNPLLGKRIHSFKIAIAPARQEVPLYARSVYGQSSTSLLHRIRDQKSDYTSEGYSVKQFIRMASLRQIDFIKIDIEGGEFDIIEDLKATVQQFNFPTVYLSLHFGQLNEALYRRKIGFRLPALALLKLEEQFRFRLFAKALSRYLSEIVDLAKHFKFIYTEFGEAMSDKNLNSRYWLFEPVNLVLTNQKWTCD